jgi:hypothetical protein
MARQQDLSEMYLLVLPSVRFRISVENKKLRVPQKRVLSLAAWRTAPGQCEPSSQAYRHTSAPS